MDLAKILIFLLLLLIGVLKVTLFIKSREESPLSLNQVSQVSQRKDKMGSQTSQDKTKMEWLAGLEEATPEETQVMHSFFFNKSDQCKKAKTYLITDDEIGHVECVNGNIASASRGRDLDNITAPPLWLCTRQNTICTQRRGDGQKGLVYFILPQSKNNSKRLQQK